MNGLWTALGWTGLVATGAIVVAIGPIYFAAWLMRRDLQKGPR